jgi:hypothetical protein
MGGGDESRLCLARTMVHACRIDMRRCVTDGTDEDHRYEDGHWTTMQSVRHEARKALAR